MKYSSVRFSVLHLKRARGKRQENIEAIVANALPHIKEDASPDQIEEDWLSNFFDKSRNVSDEEIRLLWSKVLAGEANAPGSFSKRTVNFLQSLDRREAISFQQVCRFSDDNRIVTFIYDTELPIYKEHGLSVGVLRNLQAIGLITYMHLGIRFPETDGEVTYQFSFDGQIIQVTIPKGKKFQIGKVELTTLGKEILALCTIEPVQSFAQYLQEKWMSEGFAVLRV